MKKVSPYFPSDKIKIIKPSPLSSTIKDGSEITVLPSPLFQKQSVASLRYSQSLNSGKGNDSVGIGGYNSDSYSSISTLGNQYGNNNNNINNINNINNNNNNGIDSNQTTTKVRNSRNHPSTRLETVNSFLLILILCLPYILGALVVWTDTDCFGFKENQIRQDVMYISDSNCPPYVTCYEISSTKFDVLIDKPFLTMNHIAFELANIRAIDEATFNNWGVQLEDLSLEIHMQVEAVKSPIVAGGSQNGDEDPVQVHKIVRAFTPAIALASTADANAEINSENRMLTITETIETGASVSASGHNNYNHNHNHNHNNERKKKKRKVDKTTNNENQSASQHEVEREESEEKRDADGNGDIDSNDNEEEEEEEEEDFYPVPIALVDLDQPELTGNARALRLRVDIRRSVRSPPPQQQPHDKNKRLVTRMATESTTISGSSSSTSSSNNNDDITDELLEAILSNSVMIVQTQSIGYFLTNSIVSSVLCFLAIIAAIITFFVLKDHVKNKAAASSNWRSAASLRLLSKQGLQLLLPEQIYSYILLLWLIMWLNILPGIIGILIYMEIAIPIWILFCSGLFRVMAQQGIYFTALVLMDGLKYSRIGREGHVELMKSKRAHSSVSAISFFVKSTRNALYEAGNGLYQKFTVNGSWASDRHSPAPRMFSGPAWLEEGNANYREDGNIWKNNINCNPSETDFLIPTNNIALGAIYGSTFDHDNHDHGRTLLHQSLYDDKALEMSTRSDVNGTNIDGNEVAVNDKNIGKDKDKTNGTNNGSTDDTGTDVATVPTEDQITSSLAWQLPVHHPYSPNVQYFIGDKLIFLFVTWLVTILTWCFKFPFLYSDNEKRNIHLRNTLAVFELILGIVTVFWIVYTFNAMSKSGKRLRRSRYLASRFRQMSYHVLSVQLTAGLVLIGAAMISNWLVYVRPIYQEYLHGAEIIIEPSLPMESMDMNMNMNMNREGLVDPFAWDDTGIMSTETPGNQSATSVSGNMMMNVFDWCYSSITSLTLFSSSSSSSPSSILEDMSLDTNTDVNGFSTSPSFIGFIVHLWRYLVLELKSGRQEGIGSWLFGSMGDCDVGDVIYLSFLCFGCVFIFAPPNLSPTKPASAAARSSSMDNLSNSDIDFDSTKHFVVGLDKDQPPPLPVLGISGRIETLWTRYINITYDKIVSYFPDILSQNSGGMYDRRSNMNDVERYQISKFTSRYCRKLFCLETACSLMECSWQAYYKPPKMAWDEEGEDDDDDGDKLSNVSLSESVCVNDDISAASDGTGSNNGDMSKNKTPFLGGGTGSLNKIFEEEDMREEEHDDNNDSSDNSTNSKKNEDVNKNELKDDMKKDDESISDKHEQRKGSKKLITNPFDDDFVDDINDSKNNNSNNCGGEGETPVSTASLSADIGETSNQNSTTTPDANEKAQKDFIAVAIGTDIDEEIDIAHQGLRLTRIFENVRTHTYGYMAKHVERRRIVLCFRGTSAGEDVPKNLRLNMVNQPSLKFNNQYLHIALRSLLAEDLQNAEDFINAITPNDISSSGSSTSNPRPNPSVGETSSSAPGMPGGVSLSPTSTQSRSTTSTSIPMLMQSTSTLSNLDRDVKSPSPVPPALNLGGTWDTAIGLLPIGLRAVDSMKKTSTKQNKAKNRENKKISGPILTSADVGVDVDGNVDRADDGKDSSRNNKGSSSSARMRSHSPSFGMTDINTTTSSKSNSNDIGNVFGNSISAAPSSISAIAPIGLGSSMMVPVSPGSAWHVATLKKSLNLPLSRSPKRSPKRSNTNNTRQTTVTATDNMNNSRNPFNSPTTSSVSKKSEDKEDANVGMDIDMRDTSNIVYNFRSRRDSVNPITRAMVAARSDPDLRKLHLDQVKHQSLNSMTETPGPYYDFDEDKGHNQDLSNVIHNPNPNPTSNTTGSKRESPSPNLDSRNRLLSDVSLTENIDRNSLRLPESSRHFEAISLGLDNIDTSHETTEHMPHEDDDDDSTEATSLEWGDRSSSLDQTPSSSELPSEIQPALHQSLVIDDHPESTATTIINDNNSKNHDNKYGSKSQSKTPSNSDKSKPPLPPDSKGNNNTNNKVSKLSMSQSPNIPNIQNMPALGGVGRSSRTPSPTVLGPTSIMNGSTLNSYNATSTNRPLSRASPPHSHSYQQQQQQADMQRRLSVIREAPDSNEISLFGLIKGCFKGLVSILPLAQETLPRIHGGFWWSYESIREDVIVSVAAAVFEDALQLELDVLKSHIDAVGLNNNTNTTNTTNSSTNHNWNNSYADNAGSFNPLTPPSSSPYNSYSRDRERDRIWEKEQRLKLEQMKEPLEIMITGHSLGGALAVLASLDISVNMTGILKAVDVLLTGIRANVRAKVARLINSSRNSSNSSDIRDTDNHDPIYTSTGLGSSLGLGSGIGPNTSIPPLPLPPLSTLMPSLQCYNFGSPPIGNQAFAARIQRRVPTCYRVEVDGDVISTNFMNWICECFYSHAGIHVLLDSEGVGNVLVDPTFVEGMLLKMSKKQVGNHALSKYRECLEACFENKEYISYFKKQEVWKSRIQLLELQDRIAAERALLQQSLQMQMQMQMHDVSNVNNVFNNTLTNEMYPSDGMMNVDMNMNSNNYAYHRGITSSNINTSDMMMNPYGHGLGFHATSASPPRNQGMSHPPFSMYTDMNTTGYPYLSTHPYGYYPGQSLSSNVSTQGYSHRYTYGYAPSVSSDRRHQTHTLSALSSISDSERREHDHMPPEWLMHRRRAGSIYY